jgi:hypothetical protein
MIQTIEWGRQMAKEAVADFAWKGMGVLRLWIFNNERKKRDVRGDRA